MQCVTGAAVAAGATATGLRAWLHTRAPDWLTAKRMKLITAGLLTVGVIAAGIQP
ncbi:MAG: hypothetical protein KDB52_07455 [Solirubrobacterales bacterium]|nr:hypothetical protein [Solirubrobacterales bacterium]